MKIKTDTKADIVLLTGAGASSGIGYPTLDDMSKHSIIVDDDITDLISRISKSISKGKIKTAAFEAVIAQIKEYIDIADSLRTCPVLGKEIRQMPEEIKHGKLEEKLKKALAKCYQILADEYGPKVIMKDSKGFLFLEGLFEELSKKQSELNVFTTNYDCSYQVFSKNSNKLSFLSRIQNDKKYFQSTWCNLRKDLTKSNLPKIYIHRLHGCVAWFNKNNRKGAIENTVEKLNSNRYGKLQISYKESDSMCIKLVASHLSGTNTVFSTAFQDLRNYLAHIKTLLIWGYSFRDFEVTKEINDALASNPFRIYYIDPFLKESDAKENIETTLENNATKKRNKKFSPIRIECGLYDEPKALINKIMNKVK